MELEALENQWSQLNRKLETSIRLNGQLVRDSLERRTRAALAGAFWSVVPELLLNVVGVWGMGLFHVQHLHQPRFLVPAIVLDLFWIFLVASGVRHLVRLRMIDPGGPVVRSQEELGQIWADRIRVTRAILLLSPLIWTPLLIVVLKGLFGVDAYRVLGGAFLAANVVFGVAMIPVLLWIAQRMSTRADRHPLLARFRDDLAGRSLSKAVAELAALRRFETGDDGQAPPRD